MTGPNRPPRPYVPYQPKGSIPWPTLADGSQYRLGMGVTLDRDGGTYRGTIQWVEWTDEAGKWAPPDGGAPKSSRAGKRPAQSAGRWRAVVDWGECVHEGDRPEGRVWLYELEEDSA